jgi:hypothetical protein
MTKIILVTLTIIILLSIGLYFLLRKNTDVPKKCTPITNCKTVNKNNCLVCDQCEQPYYGDTCQAKKQVITNCVVYDPNDNTKCIQCEQPYYGDTCQTKKQEITNCVVYDPTDNTKCIQCKQPYHGDTCENSCPPNETFNPSTNSCEDPVIDHCIVYEDQKCKKCKQPYYGPLCAEKCVDNQQWNNIKSTCECVYGYTGYPNCVIIPPICGGRGIKNSSGKCVCNNCPDPVRSDTQFSCAGDNCQYTDKDTCNGKGEVQLDGTCICSTYESNTEKKNKTYIGKHCSYDDNTTCNGTGVVSVDANDNATCTSCICSSINQCSYKCKVDYQNCISPSCFYNPVTKQRHQPDMNCIRNCQGLLNNCMNSISCQT